MVGTNGGGAFVHSIGLGLIVLPLMLAELALGRAGRSDAVRSLMTVASMAHASPRWSVFGRLLASSRVHDPQLLFCDRRLGDCLPGGYRRCGPTCRKCRDAGALRCALKLAGSAARLPHGLHGDDSNCRGAGISRGIEEASKILMPCLALLIAALALYSFLHGDLHATLRYLFAFNLAGITPRIALEALGLGFFSIGVGFSDSG